MGGDGVEEEGAAAAVDGLEQVRELAQEGPGGLALVAPEEALEVVEELVQELALEPAWQLAQRPKQSQGPG